MPEKQLFLLNIIRLNQENFSIFYQSSEMEKTKLANRLRKFWGYIVDEWNFVAEERSCDFHDTYQARLRKYHRLYGTQRGCWRVAEYPAADSR